MLCIKCFKKINDNELVCPHCGYKNEKTSKLDNLVDVMTFKGYGREKMRRYKSIRRNWKIMIVLLTISVVASLLFLISIPFLKFLL